MVCLGQAGPRVTTNFSILFAVCIGSPEPRGCCTVFLCMLSSLRDQCSSPILFCTWYGLVTSVYSLQAFEHDKGSTN